MLKRETPTAPRPSAKSTRQKAVIRAAVLTLTQIYTFEPKFRVIKKRVPAISKKPTRGGRVAIRLTQPRSILNVEDDTD